MCFVHVFDSFVSAIPLNMLTFKSYLLFGTHTSLDKSLKVLHLPMNSRLINEVHFV